MMAPTLNVPQSTHAKMIVSPPRLNLRRAASYQHEKAPLSSTSSRFTINQLMFSPPPSPGLPALVPRPRKSSSGPRPSRVLRITAWIAALVLISFVVRSIVKKDIQVPVSWTLTDSEEYEMVGQYDLPDFPTPIAVTDRNGRSKWTVSIPPTSEFPLTIEEYTDMCVQCREVAAHVRELHGYTNPSKHIQTDYYYEDPYFVDVSDAEKRGLLPGMEGKAWKVTAKAQSGHLVGEKADGLVDKSFCKTSLTFVLESADAGLGHTLMMLWMAYGLAQKERRSFFIDDSRWAYGEYTTIFKAPPMPDCNPPPRHEMLPCPRTARHLVVSAATAPQTFGQSFHLEYENSRRSDVKRERPVYNLARAGYEALFHLNEDDQPYVEQRVKGLRRMAKVAEGNYNDGLIVGVHIRHGDLHPYEYQYNGAYVPLNIYVQKSRELIEQYHNFSTPFGGEDVAAKQHSFSIIASDDPDVYETEEFSGSLRAQEQIKLASTQRAPKANPDKTVMHKFVDEAFGWEGGFFASMFWNLGRSTLNNANAGAAGEMQTTLKPSAETMRLRGLIGRAYMLDLAVLGQASDVVICTMSAMGCRLLAVIMGWEKAMEEERWVNIDGDFRWTALSLS